MGDASRVAVSSVPPPPLPPPPSLPLDAPHSHNYPHTYPTLPPTLPPHLPYDNDVLLQGGHLPQLQGQHVGGGAPERLVLHTQDGQVAVVTHSLHICVVLGGGGGGEVAVMTHRPKPARYLVPELCLLTNTWFWSSTHLPCTWFQSRAS